MIVWSEADNYDFALSFQEKAGCDEIWEKICQVFAVFYMTSYKVESEIYISKHEQHAVYIFLIDLNCIIIMYGA